MVIGKLDLCSRASCMCTRARMQLSRLSDVHIILCICKIRGFFSPIHHRREWKKYFFYFPFNLFFYSILGRTCTSAPCRIFDGAITKRPLVLQFCTLHSTRGRFELTAFTLLLRYELVVPMFGTFHTKYWNSFRSSFFLK